MTVLPDYKEGPILNFLNDYEKTIQDEQIRIHMKDLYKQYEDYCEKHHVKQKYTRNCFSAYMKKVGFRVIKNVNINHTITTALYMNIDKFRRLLKEVVEEFTFEHL